MTLPPSWTTSIWYKCLVCQRCFQFPGTFMDHRTQSECRFKYRNILKKRAASKYAFSSSSPSQHFQEDQEIQILFETSGKPSQRSSERLKQKVQHSEETICPENGEEEVTEISDLLTESDCTILPNSSRDLSLIDSKSPQPNQTPMKLTKVGKSRWQTDRYKCYFCDSTFKEFSLLNIHICNHTMEKPYECSVCEKRFNRKNNCNRHTLNVHDVQAQTQSCNKSVISPPNLKVHVAPIHTTTLKPFTCDICTKSFARRDTLKSHVSAVHEGFKPFSCQECQKRFNLRRSLDYHNSAVHKRPFSCKFCAKYFSQPSGLKRHILTVHRGLANRNIIKKSLPFWISKKIFPRHRHSSRL